MTHDNVSILSPPRRGVALIMLEPIPSAANIAAFAVAIFACMHVCRIPPYVVGRFLRFLACDVSPGVLIRTGSNASSIIDESTKLKPETHLDIYRHTVGCGTRATSTRRWRRGGGRRRVEGERGQAVLRTEHGAKQETLVSKPPVARRVSGKHACTYICTGQTNKRNKQYIHTYWREIREREGEREGTARATSAR
jgi:hypothetical protein